MAKPDAWPNRTDYSEAIIEPRFINDRELKNAQVERHPNGLPRVWSGQYAVVFKMKTDTRSYAVRCFVTSVKDHQARYAALRYAVRSVGGLNCLVDFDYIEKGILVNGNWYPLVKMEWVQGECLDQYIARLIDRRDFLGLRRLANMWLEVVKELRRYRLAHNDLQHENILIGNRGIRLVDYDGFYVPSLGDRLSLEQGIPHYQHPRRKPSDFNEMIDNFSVLVIYLTLRALATSPNLWQRYHQDKRLILGYEDYCNPAGSRLMQELLRISDPEVRCLAQALASACEGQVSEVPAIVCSNGHVINPCLHRICPVCREAIYGSCPCPRCRENIPYRSSYCPRCGKATGWYLLR